MRTVALIPARGGSKGIPRKNLAPLAGKPLIAWTIEAARHCAGIDRVLVSTDDEEIAAACRTLGAEVPFLRPAALALDTSPAIDAVLHALDWMVKEMPVPPTHLLLLQPTSPLRTTDDVSGALEIANRQDADGVVSVSAVRDHPYWTKTIDAEGNLSDFLPQELKATRRQDLPEVFAVNGAIYLARIEVLRDLRTFYTGRTKAYVMPPERALDIDTPWDLHLANLILGAAHPHAEN